MNTNALKKFAQQARRKLIELVTAKLNYVLKTDSAELREKASQIQKLRDALKLSSEEALIEKVAYTWFNRLMALRYMDANAYQPIGMSVVTPKQGYTLPEILDEAKQGHIAAELTVKQQKIDDLLDGKTPNANPQNEVYKILLIAACNHLSKVFPFLFERIDDYTELLLPDDLLSELSIVAFMREGMTDADCQEVEIIGWLYQFYIFEKKDEVFASKTAVKKEDIPAATQLFTPRWIVEYMVQNTVGKLWLQNKPNSRLREYMPYFIESPSVTHNDYLKINSVEEITLLDQACGSGHILVYGFELLTKIYEEEGYNASEIPKLIIEKNLFGFEIDERAAQLAGLALMMKARSYNRRFFKNEIKPNILCYKELKLRSEAIDQAFVQIGATLLTPASKHDLITMQQATNYGSLIIPHTAKTTLNKILVTLIQQETNADAFLQYTIIELKNAIEQLLLLSNKYHCIVDNPPYMGGGKMNAELSNWVKINYPKSKADLMVCFMNRAQYQVLDKGFVGMINLPSWMFLSSFEEYRKEMIEEYGMDTLLHLGRGVFGSDFGSVAFTFIKNNGPKSNGIYRRLFEEHVHVRSNETIMNLFLKKDYGYFVVNQKNFAKIPGNLIGYWKSENAIKCFEKGVLSSCLVTREGMATASNDRFMRIWSEIQNKNVLFSSDRFVNEIKWYPYNKGGAFKRWFGNDYFVINWKDDGFEIRNNIDTSTGRLRSHNYNGEFSLKRGITWTALTAGKFSARWTEEGYLFDSKGAKGFFEKNGYSILGLLNSNVAQFFLDVLAPTLDYKVGDIIQIPYFEFDGGLVNNLVYGCIKESKLDWNSRETSWDFQKNELFRIKGQDLEESYDLYQQYWRNKFFQLHKNEEELNRQFIEIYGLQEELTPDVPLEDITILKEETVIQNNQLVFKASEVFAQFMSYAVGCMFGRYSLDKEGLILANQGETLENYFLKVYNEIAPPPGAGGAFLPDSDNIIPVLDDEWFEDDIVGRFKAFLKASFGATNFDKNLAFVEECLGKDIRKYFVKDFYSDHIKRYKKRPIYWQFSSAKGAFNVLIYMHRYTPDTLGKILNDYLMQYREKLKSHIEHLNNLVVSGSSIEQTRAAKEIERLKVVLVELKDYEVSVLYPLVQERISIDLDDGVLVNYNKFGKAIKEVAGLNDTATKKKVREFDWINTAEIR
jgi:hypothetical protein